MPKQNSPTQSTCGWREGRSAAKRSASVWFPRGSAQCIRPRPRVGLVIPLPKNSAPRLSASPISPTPRLPVESAPKCWPGARRAETFLR
jgi:hypothetical protein